LRISLDATFIGVKTRPETTNLKQHQHFSQQKGAHNNARLGFAAV